MQEVGTSALLLGQKPRHLEVKKLGEYQSAYMSETFSGENKSQRSLEDRRFNKSVTRNVNEK